MKPPPRSKPISGHPVAVRHINENNNHSVAATPEDLARDIERQQMLDKGYESPVGARQAAAYIGYHFKTVQRMARRGEIPAHPKSGSLHRRWGFYISELDGWLRGKVVSAVHSCSPEMERFQ